MSPTVEPATEPPTLEEEATTGFEEPPPSPASALESALHEHLQYTLAPFLSLDSLSALSRALARPLPASIAGSLLVAKLSVDQFAALVRGIVLPPLWEELRRLGVVSGGGSGDGGFTNPLLATPADDTPATQLLAKCVVGVRAASPAPPHFFTVCTYPPPPPSNLSGCACSPRRPTLLRLSQRVSKCWRCSPAACLSTRSASTAVPSRSP